MLLEEEIKKIGLGRPGKCGNELFCKWVIKTMEPGESNLQLMLKYRLARFDPQRGRSWGVSLDWFTSKNHQGVTGSKIWGHIEKAWKVMVNGLYPLPSRSRVELLNSNFRWTEWVICKIADQWCSLVEADEDTTYPGHWLGFYTMGEENPAFVLRCNNNFIPACFQKYNITLPGPVQCYTVGTYSRCLRTWERPSGEFDGFFKMVKVIHTNRGPKNEGEQENFIFFYGKEASLRWDPDRWRWKDGGQFLKYTI